MQLRHWKTQWIPLQIYVLIVGLKVKELLTVFLRIDTRLHQESTEKEWNTIINANRIMSVRMTIEDNQDTVNALMKKLKNPPDEYKDAYDAVSDLYDAYISFTNCATDPSGSLQTYSSTFNDADTNTLNAYKTMELYLDD